VRPALPTNRIRKVLLSVLAFGLVALPAGAQSGGPRTTNTYNGHFLAPAPSVTSVGGIGASHLPPPLPSVTSLPNYSQYHPYHNGGSYRNRYSYNGRGYYGGWAYVAPYYYPVDPSGYGYDYVGAGPDLYSGPPIDPNDPTLHMIVEQPPIDPYSYGRPPEAQAYAAPQPPAAQPVPTSAKDDVKPGEPTVLVLRNGKQQEVTNYAIMGDTLYIFDGGKKKIALADLDIPATVKANDDRGLEFKMPPTAPKKTATTPAPQSTKPDATSGGTPPNIATLMQ